MKMRIGARLMLGAVLVVLAAVATVSLAAYLIARAGLMDQITSHLVSLSQPRVAHIETFLREHTEVVQIVAASSELANGLRDLKTAGGDRDSTARALSAPLELLLDPDGDIYEVLLLDQDGIVVASTTPERIGLDRSENEYFVGGQTGPFVKDAYRSATTGRASLAVSVPMFDREGRTLLGVLVAQVDMAGLNRIVADRTGLGKTGETYLINKHGFIITPSRFDEDTFLKLRVDTENARECLADLVAMRDGKLPEKHEHAAKALFDYRGVRVLGVHAYIPEMEWGLLAEIDAAEAFAPISTLKRAVLVVAGLSAGGALLLSYSFARRISRPIHELHVGAERIGAGELRRRLSIRTGDELEQLAEEFNRMAARLSESYASLERKVADRTADLRKEIAERKRIEEALRASESTYRTLLENLPQKVFLKDRNLVYVSCNGNYARDLKINPNEIAGMTDYQFYPKELAEKYRADDKRIMDSGTTEDIEEPYIQDGREVWVHTVKTAVRDAEGNVFGVLGIFWDITEQKRNAERLQRYAERLQALNSELERSNRDLQDFTYTVSHDLQEPLRKIHAYGQFLLEDCGDHIPEEGREHLQRVQGAAVRMKELIQHLLTLARVGTRGANLASVESRQVIEKVLQDMSEQVRESGAEVALQAELPVVTADAVQLGQVFQNLIGNAMKFRSAERRPKVTIGACVDGGQAVFSVADNGIGIEERFFERIFGVFQRLHLREEYEGAGVGLALCKKIIQRHGGRIWVESEVGKGSTFHLALRMAPDAEGEKS